MKKIKEFISDYLPEFILLMGAFVLIPLVSHAFPNDDKTPSYQVCFTPGDDCGIYVEVQIEQAKDSIYVQAYGFTDPLIAKHLEEASRRGVNVQAIFDKSQFRQKSSLAPEIRNSCIPTYMDNRLAIAHNKVMIIDGHIVITGSYNYTKAARFRNAENLLIIDNKDLAAQYMENWNNRKRVSEFMGGGCG